MGLILWVRYGSNNRGQNEGSRGNKGKDCNYLGSGDYSPEKADVGRSIPSLASISLNHLPFSPIPTWGLFWVRLEPNCLLYSLG